MRIHVRNHGTQLTVAVPYLRTVFQPFGQVQVGANPPGQLMGFACLDHDKIVVEHILSQRLEEMSLFASKPAGVRSDGSGHVEQVRVCPETSCWIQSFLSMRRIEARRKKASALRLRFSQSLASLRQRSSRAMMRSTIQRLGMILNPIAASDRLTISTSRCGELLQRCCKLRSLISAIGKSVFKRETSEQGRHDENAAVAILNVGRMNDGVEQQAERIDENVPLLALDLLPASQPCGSMQAPLSALFTLRPSMMAAVGLSVPLGCSLTLLIKRVMNALQSARRSVHRSK